MSRSPDQPLDRLGRAIELFLAQTPSDADRARFLAQHEDLRDLLEPLVDGAAAPAAGEIAARTLGDFRLLRELGHGGMAAVYEAIQVSLDRKVALKVLPAHLTLRPRSVARFKREAMAAASLRHPGIVEVFAVGSDGDTHFFAMELLDGPPLAEVLAAQDGGPAGRVAMVVRVGIQVAEALAYAHAHGIVHRDVKPSNILLRRDGDAVLSDFGLALQEDLPSISVAGGLAGTPHYMAPEQARGSDTVGPKADVFSLGATLYELLTGQRPFDGSHAVEVLQRIQFHDPPPPMRLAPSVGPDLSAVILKALEKSPEQRYASAVALAADLRAVQEHRPVAARQPSLPDRLRRWARRSPALAAAIVVGVLAATAIAGLCGYLIARRPLIAAALRSAQQRRCDQLLAEAWLDLYDGAVASAVARFDEVLTLEPDSLEARHGKAHALASERRYDEALRVLGPDPGPGTTDHALRWLRCTLLERAGRGDEARALEQSLPPPASPLELFVAGSRELDAGRRLEDRKRIQSAAALLERAVVTAPVPRPLFFARWAVAAGVARDATMAEHCVAGLAAHWGDEPMRWFWSGLALWGVDPARGADAFRRAIAAGLDRPAARFNLAIALEGADDMAAAVVEFEAALRQDQEGRLPAFQRGLAQLKCGRPAEAVVAFRRTVAESPDVATYRYYLGAALKLGGELEAAETELRACLAQRPGHTQARTELAALLLLAGRGSEARSELEDLLTQNPRHGEALRILGAVELHLDRPAAAVAAYDRVLAQVPTDPEARARRALALLDLGKPEAALAALLRLCEEAPRYAEGQGLLARVLVADSLPEARRDPARAVAAARTAVELTGRSKAHLLGVYAEALFQAGDVATACTTVEEALALAERPPGDTRAAAEYRRARERYRGQ